MQSVLRLRTAARLPRSVLYARTSSVSVQMSGARAFSRSVVVRKTEEESRLEEQRKIDEQKEKDKMRAYGQHYQDKEGVEPPEIAATDETISHAWEEVCIQFWSGASRIDLHWAAVKGLGRWACDDWSWPWTPSGEDVGEL